MRRRLRTLGLIIGFTALSVMAAQDAEAIIGRPLTPMSYAGVARRTTRRAAYAGAATGYGGYGYGYAAPAPPVAAMPAGCAPGVPCGGMTYQPAYSGTQVVYVPQ
jgi:hypothetical protein